MFVSYVCEDLMSILEYAHVWRFAYYETFDYNVDFGFSFSGVALMTGYANTVQGLPPGYAGSCKCCCYV